MTDDTAVPVRSGPQSCAGTRTPTPHSDCGSICFYLVSNLPTNKLKHCYSLHTRQSKTTSSSQVQVYALARLRSMFGCYTALRTPVPVGCIQQPPRHGSHIHTVRVLCDRNRGFWSASQFLRVPSGRPVVKLRNWGWFLTIRGKVQH